MSNWHLSTISRLAANGVGQIFSTIFRNGDAGFGGYIVRLMLISGMGKTDLPVNQWMAFASLKISKPADDLARPSGWDMVALTIPRLN